jgi:hypothetical protein
MCLEVFEIRFKASAALVPVQVQRAMAILAMSLLGASLAHDPGSPVALGSDTLLPPPTFVMEPGKMLRPPPEYVTFCKGGAFFHCMRRWAFGGHSAFNV